MDDAGTRGPAGSGNAETGLPERPVTVNQLVAFNLMYFRKAAGLTQEELGKLLGGWSNAAVSAAERSWDGKRIRKFDGDEITLFAMVLGVPLIALFLPPEDADTAVRYVLDGYEDDGQPDMAALFAYVVPRYGGDTSALAAYQKRLIALAPRYVEPREGLTEQIVGDAIDRVQHLERDAVERHRHALGGLMRQRELLENRIDDLRMFERDYRSRLIAYLERLLGDLRAPDTESPKPARYTPAAEPGNQETAELGSQPADRDTAEQEGMS